MKAEEYFGDWLRYIDLKELEDTLRVISKKAPFYPEPKDVFKAFKECSAKDVVAVFLGQDPYPVKGRATGLMFGNPVTTDEKKLSPSLQVIRDSLMGYDMPHHERSFDITMESWARQGILMLNTSLTVSPGKPGSHSLYWRPFIRKFLTAFSLCNTGMTYVLFGRQAQSFKDCISHMSGKVIELRHPASLARDKERYPEGLFLQIGKHIRSVTGKDIRWYKQNDLEYYDA